MRGEISMSEPNATPNPAAEPETTPEHTFTQAEVDKLVGDRLAKVMKGMPSKEELAAYRAWKESQQTEQEKWNTLTKERDESRTALAAAQAELEQHRREKLLLGKGIPAEDVDYYAFKIGQLVTDSLPFEKAAEQFLKDRQPAQSVKVDFSAPVGGSGGAASVNDMMNSLIRGARK